MELRLEKRVGWVIWTSVTADRLKREPPLREKKSTKAIL
jgi:hypothetical protein